MNLDQFDGFIRQEYAIDRTISPKNWRMKQKKIKFLNA